MYNMQLKLRKKRHGKRILKEVKLGTKKKKKYCDTVNHFAIATYPIWYAIALSRLVAATHVSAQKKLRPPTTIATWYVSK